MRTAALKHVSQALKNYRPQSDSEPLASEALCELWAVFAEIFGTRWTSAQPETPSQGWIGMCGDLSAADIGTGLIALRNSGAEWPPSAVEFRAMCRPVKRENAAAYVVPPERQLPHKLDDSRRQKGRAAIAEMKRKIACN